MIKKLCMLALLSIVCATISAQINPQEDTPEIIELRNKIGIDYSMPDFSTSRLDGKVVGTRLAKMLKLLQNRFDDYVFNQRISFIQCEQIENLQYAKVEKFKIFNISKVGDVITIKAKTKISPNAAKIKNSVIFFVFEKGVSEIQSINELFSDLSRYIKE